MCKFYLNMIALFIVSIISSSFSKEVTGCRYDNMRQGRNHWEGRFSCILVSSKNKQTTAVTTKPNQGFRKEKPRSNSDTGQGRSKVGRSGDVPVETMCSSEWTALLAVEMHLLTHGFPNCAGAHLSERLKEMLHLQRELVSRVEEQTVLSPRGLFLKLFACMFETSCLQTHSIIRQQHAKVWSIFLTG